MPRFVDNIIVIYVAAAHRITRTDVIQRTVYSVYPVMLTKSKPTAGSAPPAPAVCPDSIKMILLMSACHRHFIAGLMKCNCLLLKTYR